MLSLIEAVLVRNTQIAPSRGARSALVPARARARRAASQHNKPSA